MTSPTRVWLLRLVKSPVMLPIPGISQVAHLDENLSAAIITLTDEEAAALESLA
ncbi:aldo/keto reductase [Nonomuraea sp. H19]|uniref:aldo/keto reductase n=1 Tax=Nonomuraea sp. H19 TaxID=3452206 RepID=UPI003F8B67AF